MLLAMRRRASGIAQCFVALRVPFKVPLRVPLQAVRV